MPRTLGAPRRRLKMSYEGYVVSGEVWVPQCKTPSGHLLPARWELRTYVGIFTDAASRVENEHKHGPGHGGSAYLVNRDGLLGRNIKMEDGFPLTFPCKKDALEWGRARS